MNNETKAQLQAISDNVLNLNYDEILFGLIFYFARLNLSH